MTALIDGDNMFYTISHNYRDIEATPESIAEVKAGVDSFLESICTMTRCEYYLGALSRTSFRNELYLYAPYKGNRKEEKPEYFDRWKPIIEEQLLLRGFFYLDELEADDIIIAAAVMYNQNKQEYVICSPDKDLKQVHGIHYDYRKGTDPEVILPEQAEKHFWMQMLTGDTSDNVKAIPGLGEVKAKKILDEVDPIQYESTVLAQYEKYFGNHYGKLIFTETLWTVQMMSPLHALWNNYSEYIKEALAKHLQEYKQVTRPTPFDQTITNEVFPWIE